MVSSWIFSKANPTEQPGCRYQTTNKKKEGNPKIIDIGNLKKTKSSTQFFDGPNFLEDNMTVLASATLPNTPPALVAPKGAL